MLKLTLQLNKKLKVCDMRLKNFSYTKFSKKRKIIKLMKSKPVKGESYIKIFYYDE